MAYDGGSSLGGFLSAYQPSNDDYKASLAAVTPGAKMTGTQVLRNGNPYLQQQYGTDRFGNPQYSYVAMKGGPNDGSANPPVDTSIHPTDAALIARLAQGPGGGSGQGGVVSTNPYGGILAAPPAPQNNGILQQFLARLSAQQQQPAVQPGTPGMAPLPGQAPPPATSIGGGSSMPTGGGNGGFLAMLQGLKASGSPMSAPTAPVGK